MSVYQQMALASSLSEFVTSIHAQHEALMSMQRGSTEPTIKPIGTLWHNTTAGKIQHWSGLAWADMFKPGVLHVAVDGSAAYTANQPMGGFILTGLGVGTASGHSVSFDQAILVSGDNPFEEDQSMGGHRLTNLGAPVDNTDAVRKGYVDSAFANVAKIEHVLEPDIQIDGTDVINDIGFVPRKLVVRIYGDILKSTPGFTMWDSQRDTTLEAHFFDDESGKGFSPGDVWLSNLITGSSHDWRLRLTRVDGSEKGFKIEFLRESDGDRGMVDVYGGSSGAGVCQVLAFG